MSRPSRRPRTPSGLRSRLGLEHLEVRDVPTGFTTSVPSFVDGLLPGVTIQQLLTAGDAVPMTGSPGQQYRMTGIPDGLGAHDNGDGTITVYMNHEFNYATLTNPVVGGPALQGAYVTQAILDKATLGVISAKKAYSQVFVGADPNPVPAADAIFGRFCSGFLAGPEVGFDTYIYMPGEEAAETFTAGRDTFSGIGGVAAAIVDDALYVLPDLGYFAWENQVVLPNTGNLTVVMGLEDGTNLDSQLYMYVGVKQPGNANPVVRNGLVGGQLYAFKSATAGETDEASFHKADGSISGTWVEVDASLNETDLETAADAAGAFGFVRVEDGASDHNTPGRFYFATTGSTFKAAGTYPNKLGRIYQLDVNPADPLAGATLRIMLEGDAGDPVVNPDNLDINPLGQMVIQEDPNGEHNGTFLGGRDTSLWMFDVNTGAVNRFAQIDQAAVPNTAGFRGAPGTWETSGVTDLSHIYGPGNWLFDVQAHTLNGAEASSLVGSPSDLGLQEGGQLLYLNTSRMLTPQSLSGFQHAGTYTIGTLASAEISAYDPLSRRLFVLNSPANAIDIVDAGNPAALTKIGTINLGAFGGSPNSVAVKNGIVAVAVEAVNRQDPGVVAFFTASGAPLGSVPVGAVPDMVTFTPNGTKVLVANEGEPSSYNQVGSIDPEGSVTIVDITNGITGAVVTTVGFTAFNGQEAQLRAQGIRIFGPNATAAQDFEPEYISVSPDGSTAFVTLQENNALAVIDLATNTLTSLVPLGAKDFSTGLGGVQNYTFDDASLPVVGTTPAGQQIKLGGFSGLFFEGIDAATGNLKFVTHTDRGPNGEPIDLVPGSAGLERPFALPTFQPRLVRFELNRSTGQITITQQILLTKADGSPLTGLSNLQAGAQGTPHTDEVAIDLFGNVIPNDPLGADLEGVVVAPDGSFWMVDEYRPAIYHFDPTGKLLDRFVPQGVAAAAGLPAGTFGTEVLPAVYGERRRANRGFEAVAFDPATNKLYAFVQTTLDNPNTSTTGVRNNGNVRIVEFDVVTEAVTAEYLYVLRDTTAAGAAKTDKIGDAVYLGNGKFLVIERDDRTGFDSNKLIYEIDLTGATNILGLPNVLTAPAAVAGQTIEQLDAAELIASGIKPVNKRLAANAAALGYTGVSKPEGLARIDANTFALLNDTDFGVLAAATAGDGSVPLNPNPEPIRLGILSFAQSNGLDPSDRDTNGINSTTPSINIRNAPVLGLYMPDAIGTFTSGGQTYLITANEGDARDYTGFTEEVRVNAVQLDAAAFPQAAFLTKDAQLGRLTITSVGPVGTGKPFTSTLNAAQEVPAGTSTATGRAVVTMNAAGTALAVSINVTGLDFGALAGGTPRTASTADDVTMVHIHNAIRGANGAVVWDIATAAAKDDDLRIYFEADGSTTIFAVWEASDPQSLTAFVAALQGLASGTDADLYFNIHTTANPTGDIRGQLVAASGTVRSGPIETFGGRSFTIRDATGRVVFDSGDMLERLTAQFAPALFNSNGDPGTFDTRSDNKGPEPEALAVGVVNGRTFAFIGLERTGGVMVFDVTDPTAPTFVQYLTTPGDVSPEGLIFIPAAESPTGRAMIAVSHEVSGTVTLYDFNTPPSVDLNGAGIGVDETAAFTEGTPVVVAPNLTLSDAEGGVLSSATVLLAFAPDGSAESLTADTTGTAIVASYDPASRALTLTGTDTVANYQQVLRTVRYANSSDTPDAASRTLTFSVSDGRQDSPVAVATVTITPVNDVPVATGDAYTVTFGGTLSVSAADGVLANDTDPEGDALTAVLGNAPPASAGTLTLNPDGSFVFTPAAGFSGPTTFTYTATDGITPSAPATVTITVGQPPVVRPKTLPTTIATSAPTAGVVTTVSIRDASGTALRTFTPFPGFTGEVYVSQADMNGDGVFDLIAGTGDGGTRT